MSKDKNAEKINVENKNVAYVERENCRKWKEVAEETFLTHTLTLIVVNIQILNCFLYLYLYKMVMDWIGDVWINQMMLNE